MIRTRSVREHPKYSKNRPARGPFLKSDNLNRTNYTLASHCAMVFDGVDQTGSSAILDIGEHTCCDNGPMPLNDILESIYVTPATG